MTPAKIIIASMFSLMLASVTVPVRAASARNVMQEAHRITPTDVSASRHHTSRTRHATRIRIYHRGDYSFFEPYAPPVPFFFPFGYTHGYF